MDILHAESILYEFYCCRTLIHLLTDKKSVLRVNSYIIRGQVWSLKFSFEFFVIPVHNNFPQSVGPLLLNKSVYI
jgi:hypothetical protein